MSYSVFVEPDVHARRQNLPGHVRQRIARLIHDLSSEPRPSESQTLEIVGLELLPHVELRRIRLEHWRVIYAVNDAEQWAWVLGIYRRPPYDYKDLGDLLNRLR